MFPISGREVRAQGGDDAFPRVRGRYVVNPQHSISEGRPGCGKSKAFWLADIIADLKGVE